MKRRIGAVSLAVGTVGVLIALPAPWSATGDYCDCVLSNGLQSPVLATLLTLTSLLLFAAAVTKARRPFNAGGLFLVPLWCCALWVVALWSTGSGDASIEMTERWGFWVLTISLALAAVGYLIVAWEPDTVDASA
jgi:hypothetical protein